MCWSQGTPQSTKRPQLGGLLGAVGGGAAEVASVRAEGIERGEKGLLFIRGYSLAHRASTPLSGCRSTVVTPWLLPVTCPSRSQGQGGINA